MKEAVIPIDDFLERFKVEKEKQSQGTKTYNVYLENALFSILTHYKDYLPKLDAGFHRAFRITNVLPSKDLDHAVWNLLFCSDAFYVVVDQFETELGIDFSE